MAAPAVAGTPVESATVAGTSHSISVKASNPAAGDLSIVVFGLADWSGFSDVDWANATPLPYTNLGSNNTIGSGSGVNIGYRYCTGSEGSTSITVGSAVNAKGAAIAYIITGAADPTVLALDSAFAASVASTTPDPPSLDPSGAGPEDLLFLAGFAQDGEEADDDTWCNNAPTSYSNLLQKTSGTGGAAASNVNVATATRTANGHTGSEDPATFGTDLSAAWAAFTIAVHPAAPGTAMTPPRREPRLSNRLRDVDPWSVSGWLAREERRIAAERAA